MKKIIFLVLLLLIIILPVSSAYERYQWMWSTDKVGYFFDKNTIKFDNSSGHVNTDVIDVWIKTVFSPEAAQEIIDRVDSEYIKNKLANFDHKLTHYQIKVSSSKIKELDDCWYSSDGNLIHEFDDTYQPWKPIIPGSNSEGWQHRLMDYILNNWKTVYDRS
ncbi:hypothetical protein Ga0466249_004798 [Sporomusaceae bacterium BoRhaA]|uniref:hypothetical protein n=1 Tax=Pelorhabdus rhamnosifermentans TaxID=2772457 RepID=UPI001C0611D8|nr:hypothetical protein [Pelorhabdus rhamnosifermentans]MBU2703650.1 hypothetical protein [Pelorhabdus rhamnosifermentans]